MADNSSAMLSWGISTFVGGEFSQANGEKVISVLNDFNSPRWIYFPNDTWRSFIKSAYADRLKDKYLHLYQFDNTSLVSLDKAEPCIVPITQGFLEKNLPNTECVTDELYSYTDIKDFFQNGFGLALVIDGTVSGYCLSEYSIHNGHGINIWIDARYRGLGYGRKMVSTFLLHCREKNETAYWVCNADNIPSNKLAVSSGLVLKSKMYFFEI